MISKQFPHEHSPDNFTETLKHAHSIFVLISVSLQWGLENICTDGNIHIRKKFTLHRALQSLWNLYLLHLNCNLTFLKLLIYTHTLRLYLVGGSAKPTSAKNLPRTGMGSARPNLKGLIFSPLATWFRGQKSSWPSSVCHPANQNWFPNRTQSPWRGTGASA